MSCAAMHIFFLIGCGKGRNFWWLSVISGGVVFPVELELLDGGENEGGGWVVDKK